MASLFAPPPLPPTKLGRYRTLSPLAGVRVSPLQLGAMSIGDKWHEFGMGSMDKQSSFKLLDAYFDAGVRRLSPLSRVIPIHTFHRGTLSIPRTISEVPVFEVDDGS
jgi:hypothetical protein